MHNDRPGLNESDESFWNHDREDEPEMEMDMEPASQFAFSQTQRSTHPEDEEPSSFDVQSSQVNPRRKYCESRRAQMSQTRR